MAINKKKDFTSDFSCVPRPPRLFSGVIPAYRGCCEEGLARRIVPWRFGMFRFKKIHVLSVVLGAALVSSTQAQPFSQLKIDINDVKVTMSSAFFTGGASAFGGGSAYTGDMTFAMATSPVVTNFAGNWFGNNNPTPAVGPFFDAGSPGTLFSITGLLRFSAGTLTGVSFGFSNAAGDGGDSFSTLIASGGTLIYIPAGASSTYEVTGLTFSGFFLDPDSNSAFSAVDISRFLSGGLAHGLIKNFLIPDVAIAAGGFTEQVQIDLFIVIPLPGGAGLAGFGLIALGVRRRRI
ncbi:MAG: hypothetical protein IH985_00465 [Planctomycetes bacterium]|nr:hypothetical protein [Planctomycetota bacterium]